MPSHLFKLIWTLKYITGAHILSLAVFLLHQAHHPVLIINMQRMLSLSLSLTPFPSLCLFALRSCPSSLPNYIKLTCMGTHAPAHTRRAFEHWDVPPHLPSTKTHFPPALMVGSLNSERLCCRNIWYIQRFRKWFELSLGIVGLCSKCNLFGDTASGNCKAGTVLLYHRLQSAICVWDPYRLQEEMIGQVVSASVMWQSCICTWKGAETVFVSLLCQRKDSVIVSSAVCLSVSGTTTWPINWGNAERWELDTETEKVCFQRIPIEPVVMAKNDSSKKYYIDLSLLRENKKEA